MTASPTDRQHPLRYALAGVGLLCAVPAAGQEAQPSAAQTPSRPADETASPGSDQGEGLPDFWERLPAPRAAGDTLSDVRPYLGPLPVAAPESEPVPAERPPTSILIGPYIPEGEIALPDLDTGTAQETGAQEAAAAEPPPAQTEPDAADAALASDIAVDTLSTLSPAAIGAWSEGEGEPFPVDMWRGASRETLIALIPELPMTVRSPVMRALARRLLLSPARLPGEPRAAPADQADPESAYSQLPAGEAAPEANPGAAAQSPDAGIDAESLEMPVAAVDMRLLTLRLGRLRAGGAVRDLLALAERLTDATMTEEILRLKTDALLVLGDYDAACSAARDGVTLSGAAYWLRALAMCEALAGNRDAAFFRLNLLAETGESPPGFATLVEALLAEIEGNAVALPEDVLAGAARPDTVLFALSRLTRAPIPRALALSAEPLVLDALVELPDFDAETHLAIAGQALDLGLLGGETLREIYAAVPFTGDELANAAEILAAARAEENSATGRQTPDATESSETGAGSAAAEPPDIPATGESAAPARPPIRGLRLEALLYQKALGADDPEVRLQWMAELMARAREAERSFAVAEALSAPLSAVAAEPSLAPFAAVAGRIHLTVGDVDAALRWNEAARITADMGSAAARDALIRLWPLLVVTDRSESVPYSRRMLELWWQGRAELERSERLMRGDRLFSLLAELGYEVPADLRHAAMAAPHRMGMTPPSTLWRQLIIAAMDKRLGEGVLLALTALGRAGSDAAQPPVLASAVGALAAVGLDAQARRLALESLVAAGF